MVISFNGSLNGSLNKTRVEWIAGEVANKRRWTQFFGGEVGSYVFLLPILLSLRRFGRFGEVVVILVEGKFRYSMILVGGYQNDWLKKDAQIKIDERRDLHWIARQSCWGSPIASTV